MRGINVCVEENGNLSLIWMTHPPASEHRPRELALPEQARRHLCCQFPLNEVPMDENYRTNWEPPWKTDVLFISVAFTACRDIHICCRNIIIQGYYFCAEKSTMFDHILLLPAPLRNWSKLSGIASVNSSQAPLKVFRENGRMHKCVLHHVTVAHAVWQLPVELWLWGSEATQGVRWAEQRPNVQCVAG